MTVLFLFHSAACRETLKLFQVPATLPYFKKGTPLLLLEQEEIFLRVSVWRKGDATAHHRVVSPALLVSV